MTTTPTHSEQFWVTEPGKGELIRKPLPSISDEDIVIKTLYTGISRGTETLVFHGRVPVSQYNLMRAPFQEGDFPSPVKYGYSNVGTCIYAPDSFRTTFLNKTFFSLFPHQDFFVIPSTSVIELPSLLPPERAILAPSMETAINATWDGKPKIGDNIMVIGGGVIGLLVAYLSNRIEGAKVLLVDPESNRKRIADALNIDFSTEPTRNFSPNLIFHASGNPNGLRTALSLAPLDSTIVELSWYGDKEISLPLGEHFHSHRLTLQSSQVSNIPPSHSPQWDHKKRLELALKLLMDNALDILIAGESPFEEMPKLFSNDPGTPAINLCHRITYLD